MLTSLGLHRNKRGVRNISMCMFVCGGGAHTCMCMGRSEVNLTGPSSGSFYLSSKTPSFPDLEFSQTRLFRLASKARVCCMSASTVHNNTPSLGVRVLFWTRLLGKGMFDLHTTEVFSTAAMAASPSHLSLLDDRICF